MRSRPSLRFSIGALAAAVVFATACADYPTDPTRSDVPEVQVTAALPELVRPNFNTARENLEPYKHYLGGSAYRFFYGQPDGVSGAGFGPSFGTGLSASRSGLATRRSPRDGADVLVNDPGGLGIGQSEVGVAAGDFGKFVVLAWNDAAGFLDFLSGVSGWGFSADGGRTFTDGGSFPRMPTDGFIHFGDPDVDARRPGKFLFADLCFDFSTDPIITGICVTRGHVAGGTIIWDTPIFAAADDGNTNFLDKPFMAVSPSGRDVYVSYTRFSVATPFGQIEVVASHNGGHSFGAPVVVGAHISDVVQQGSEPAVGPHGELYVVWERGFLTSPTPEIVISKDFGAPTVVATISSIALSPPSGYNRPVINDFPRIDVMRRGKKRGRVFVTFHSGIPGDADIFVTHSPGGSGWSPPVRVNDDGPGAEQWWPDIVTGDGKVFVMWYDRRLNPGTAVTNVFWAQLKDGGHGFHPNVRVSDVGTDWLATATDIVPNFGDYNTVTVRRDGIHRRKIRRSRATRTFNGWGDGRLGTPDVFFSHVISSP